MSNAEEEMEIAENVPLLHNKYKIFRKCYESIIGKKTVKMETGKGGQ
jgi:hypothetical protein